jgi:hypothetical protein
VLRAVLKGQQYVLTDSSTEGKEAEDRHTKVAYTCTAKGKEATAQPMIRFDGTTERKMASGTNSITNGTW